MTSRSELSPELQLLILAARPQLDPNQIATLRSLAAADLDWDRLSTLARLHGVRPLLLRTLKAHCVSFTPETVLDELDKFQRFNIAHTMLLTSELARIMALLVKQNILVVPYKGVVLGDQLYGDAALRETGDIDIIVPKDRIPEATDLFQAADYRRRYAMSPQDEVYYLQADHHYALVHRQRHITLEIHWDIISYQQAIDIDWSGVWHRAAQTPYTLSAGSTVDASTLAPEDSLLFLLIHGGQERWESLRWIVDIDAFVKQQRDLDWHTLLNRAQHWRVERLILLGLHLAYSLLATPLPDRIHKAIDQDRKITSLSQCTLSLHESTDRDRQPDINRVFYALSLREKWSDRFTFLLRLPNRLSYARSDAQSRETPMPFHQQLRRHGWQSISGKIRQILVRRSPG